MKLNPELIIFDCDGVLVDSELIANQVLCEGLNRLGLAYTLERTMQNYMGKSFASCISMIEAEYRGEIAPLFWQQLQQQTYTRFDHELKAVSGVPELLNHLSIRDCVASSGRHEKIRKTLGLTGLLPHFSNRIFSAEDVSRGKPFPDLFLHAATELGVAPENVLVVEDSNPGIEAAISAGMNVVHYTAGFEATPAPLPQTETRVLKIDHMLGLLDLLEQPSHPCAPL